MSSVESGARVATAIGVVKWVLISFALIGGALAVFGAAAGGNDGPFDAFTVVLIIVASTAAWILFVWVLFGWFEHTLSALVTIARNTSAPMPHQQPGGPVSAGGPVRL